MSNQAGSDVSSSDSGNGALFGPFVLEPMFYEKVWGGQALKRLGKAIAPDKLIGESWELADMPTTSASGAGGAPARSRIVSGPLKGKTLGDALAIMGPRLLGNAKKSEAGGFPLLVKFLDAKEHLSVQVHPSPAYASRHADCKLKTECWYILDAQEVDGKPAVIFKGVKPGVSKAQFQRAIEQNAVAELMVAVPAVVGECHNLPSGTVHALGAGVLVAEVQTPSDTTFHVFDWGRTGRELHVAQALECIDFGPAPQAHKLVQGQSSARLVTTEFFTLDELRASTGERLSVGISSESKEMIGQCAVIIVLHGSCEVHSTKSGKGECSRAFDPLNLQMGETMVVPAWCAGQTELVAQSELTVLRAMVK